MFRGCVWACLLVGCLLSIGVIADEKGNIPFISPPSLSITSVGQDDTIQHVGKPVQVLKTTSVIQATNKIVQGSTVFIGEKNLDISDALENAGSIAWWKSGNEGSSTPDAVIPITDPLVFFVDPMYFSLKTGCWYQWADNQKGHLAIIIADPSLSLKIRDVTFNEDVTGKVIPRNNTCTFVLETNLYPIMNRSGYMPADSRFKITITGPAGDNYTFLAGAGGDQNDLTRLQVDKSLWYWIGLQGDHSVPDPHDGWNTSVTYINGTPLYEPGVYTVRAECNANDMKDNYKAPDGSDYTNKTVSIVSTVTLAEDLVSIIAEPEQVVPGESFVTTVTGLPDTEYHLWMKGTGPMTGNPGDQPPIITPAQDNVWHDASAGPFIIGAYVFSHGRGKTIHDDIPHDPISNGSQFYAKVKLDSTGQKTVLWNTSAVTKAGRYVPAVERKTETGYVGDTCKVSVGQENPVTIEAAGVQPFSRGKSVSLTGKNSASEITYLFMTGSGLPSSGGSLQSPLTPVLSDEPSGFDLVMVTDNDTWIYNWVIPHSIPCDGIFTLYAVSTPKNLTGIGQAVYSLVPVTISSSGNTSSISLIPGWNLVSTPSVLKSGNDTMAVFSEVNSSGHSVLTYNSTISSWMTMKSDDLLYPLNGIWIYSVTSVDIPLISDNGTISPRNLVKGWNCIGIVTPDRTAGSVLQPLDSLWSYLVGFNATVQQYKSPLIAGDPAVNITPLHIKEGSWIYLKENGTFSG